MPWPSLTLLELPRGLVVLPGCVVRPGVTVGVVRPGVVVGVVRPGVTVGVVRPGSVVRPGVVVGVVRPGVTTGVMRPDSSGRPVVEVPVRPVLVLPGVEMLVRGDSILPLLTADSKRSPKLEVRPLPELPPPTLELR